MNPDILRPFVVSSQPAIIFVLVCFEVGLALACINKFFRKKVLKIISLILTLTASVLTLLSVCAMAFFFKVPIMLVYLVPTIGFLLPVTLVVNYMVFREKK